MVGGDNNPAVLCEVFALATFIDAGEAGHAAAPSAATSSPKKSAGEMSMPRCLAPSRS